MIFYWLVKGMFYPFVRLYLGLRREGLEHLPRTELWFLWPDRVWTHPETST